MKTLFIVLSAGLLGSAACRDRTTAFDDPDRTGMTKPIEQPAPMTEPHDDDFIQTRSSFETSMRERLNRLDARIDQLESRTDAAGNTAANQLRARRDALADRMNQAKDQTEAGWDKFEADMSRSFDELERDVDDMTNF